MANAMRASGSGVPVLGVLGVLGTAYEMTTFVRIRWGWVPLPAIVILMTGAFLVAGPAEESSDGNEIVEEQRFY